MTDLDKNPYYQRLYNLKEKYKDRRGLVQQFFYECITLVESAHEEAFKQAAEQITRNEGFCEGKVAQANQRFDEEREARRRAEERYADILEDMNAKRVFREERSKTNEEVKINLRKDYSRDWSIKDLEEAAYRLRMAGGVDDTEVKMSEYFITSYVPDPNMIRLGLGESSKEVEVPEKRRFPLPRTNFQTVVTISSVTAFLALIALVGTLIF
jgi:hypothetical protein